MVVAPDEVDWGVGIAWAYAPGPLSAFRDDYANRMGVQVRMWMNHLVCYIHYVICSLIYQPLPSFIVQMHEFGHNIGLHHSGYDTGSYADHSCIMGNPSYGDDGPKICWNAAKVRSRENVYMHYYVHIYMLTFVSIRVGSLDGISPIRLVEKPLSSPPPLGKHSSL